MSIFFSSDHHFGHTNVIKYCGRPFGSAEEMDEAMILAWNDKVARNDVVYHLGDFCFGSTQTIKAIRSRLNGKIHLIKGNHDYKWQSSAFLAFDSVENLRQIKMDNQTIVLCHFPLLSWNKSYHGSWHLNGHSHATIPFDPAIKRLDVGVDGHPDFAPYSFDEIKTIFENPDGFQYTKRI